MASALLKRLALREDNLDITNIIPTQLCGINELAHSINNDLFNKLSSPIYKVRGSFKWYTMDKRGLRTPCETPNTVRNYHEIEDLHAENLCVPREYEIRVGAQILVRVNIKELDVVNGTRGVIEEIKFSESDPKTISGVVFRDGDDRSIFLPFVPCERTVYDRFGEKILEYLTIPICLGWAITIHKAQGYGEKKIYTHHNFRTFLIV